MSEMKKPEPIKLPCGQFCSRICTDNCKYWEPHKKDSNGRTYCYWYKTHYYPYERSGCLSYEKA